MEMASNEVSEIAKLSVVGVGMRSHAGVAAELFAALAEGGVNIELVSTSESKSLWALLAAMHRTRRVLLTQPLD